MKLGGFKNIRFKKRDRCVICGKRYGLPVINIPKFPLTEIYIDRRINDKLGFVDQEFHLCKKCGHGQIANVIDEDILYGDSYRTRTSTSSSAVPAVDVFLDFINSSLKKRTIKTIFEIGCNDLYALKKLRNKADILYGVDPMLNGIESSYKDDKIKIIGDFFENIDVKNIGLKADVVFSSHTLEHVEDPKKMVHSLLDLSSNDATFFFQFPGLEALINNAHFDQIFHQHLNYFSLQSVLYLLDELDAEPLDFKVNPYHWGALMIAFRKKTSGSNRNCNFRKKTQKISSGLINRQYDIFKENIALTARRIDSFDGRTIYGYGAALMFPVLEYYLKRAGHLKCIIDEDPSKKDLYYLNVPVQIKMPNQIKNIKNSVVLVTAINSMQAARTIMKKLIQLNVNEIIMPVGLI